MTKRTVTSSSSFEDAQELMVLEQWAKAFEILRDVCEREPSNYAAHWDAGWCFVKMERPSEAVGYLETATALSPDRPDSHWALGVASSAAGHFSMAEEALKRSLELKDTYAARISLGVLYMKQDRLTEAEGVYREGVRLRPTHRERVEALADFLSDTGRRTEAIKLYEQGMSMTPREVRKQQSLRKKVDRDLIKGS